MKIVRNGVEIELTPRELREAFLEMEKEYLIEDIQSRAEDMEVVLDKHDIATVVNMAQSGLERNDSYWESYWATIEYAIENCKDEIIL